MANVWLWVRMTYRTRLKHQNTTIQKGANKNIVTALLHINVSFFSVALSTPLNTDPQTGA